MKQGIDLFTPIQLGSYELRNRMVMAPLTRNRAGQGQVPQPMNVRYYRQRASAGLIISEATQVCPEGVGYPNTPGIHSLEQVKGWRTITEAVHQEGGRIFLQLWHAGRISHPSLQPGGVLPVAPSAIKPDGDAVTYDGLNPFVTPRALDITELPGIVAHYRHGAHYALEAGFDGVEVHSANGYLLDQFLRDGSNHRTDAYGGSIENRARLLFEVVEAVTQVWGVNRVGVRISPVNPFNSMQDSDPDTTFGYVAKKLGVLKLAYLHVVEMDQSGVTTGQSVDFHRLRDLFGGIYMVCGCYTYERATAALAKGEADLIAFGRLFIANPDLPKRFAKGAPLNVPHPETFYGGTEKGYTDYPSLAGC